MNLRRTFSSLLLGLGAAGIALNIAGNFLAKEVSFSSALPGYEAGTADDRPSAAQFREQSRRREGESASAFVERLTALVSRRMVYVSPDTELPTILDNWILWPYAQWKGRYEWSDADKAVTKGGGYCSQHAIVLQALVTRAGLPSRILPLSGHVVNEVLVDGNWRVFDSTFGVSFNDSADALATEPEAVAHAYLRAGQTATNASRWTDALVTLHDNRKEVSVRDYVGVPYLFEKAAIWGVWLIPALLISAGLALRRAR